MLCRCLGRSFVLASLTLLFAVTINAEPLTNWEQNVQSDVQDKLNAGSGSARTSAGVAASAYAPSLGGPFWIPGAQRYAPHPWEDDSQPSQAQSLATWKSDSAVIVPAGNSPTFSAFFQCFEPRVISQQCPFCHPKKLRPQDSGTFYTGSCPKKDNSGFVFEYWWPEFTIELTDFGVSAINPVTAWDLQAYAREQLVEGIQINNDFFKNYLEGYLLDGKANAPGPGHGVWPRDSADRSLREQNLNELKANPIFSQLRQQTSGHSQHEGLLPWDQTYSMEAKQIVSQVADKVAQNRPNGDGEWHMRCKKTKYGCPCWPYFYNGYEKGTGSRCFYNTGPKPRPKVTAWSEEAALLPYWRIPEMSHVLNQKRYGPKTLYQWSVPPNYSLYDTAANAPGARFDQWLKQGACVSSRLAQKSVSFGLEDLASKLGIVENPSDILKRICYRGGGELYPTIGTLTGPPNQMFGSAVLTRRMIEVTSRLTRPSGGGLFGRRGSPFFADRGRDTADGRDSIDKLQRITPYPTGCFNINQIDEARHPGLFPTTEPPLLKSTRYVYWNKRQACVCPYRGKVDPTDGTPVLVEYVIGEVSDHGWGCQPFPCPPNNALLEAIIGALTSMSPEAFSNIASLGQDFLGSLAEFTPEALNAFGSIVGDLGIMPAPLASAVGGNLGTLTEGIVNGGIDIGMLQSAFTGIGQAGLNAAGLGHVGNLVELGSGLVTDPSSAMTIAGVQNITGAISTAAPNLVPENFTAIGQLAPTVGGAIQSGAFGNGGLSWEQALSTIQNNPTIQPFVGDIGSLAQPASEVFTGNFNPSQLNSVLGTISSNPTLQSKLPQIGQIASATVAATNGGTNAFSFNSISSQAISAAQNLGVNTSAMSGMPSLVSNIVSSGYSGGGAGLEASISQTLNNFGDDIGRVGQIASKLPQIVSSGFSASEANNLVQTVSSSGLSGSQLGQLSSKLPELVNLAKEPENTIDDLVAVVPGISKGQLNRFMSTIDRLGGSGSGGIADVQGIMSTAGSLEPAKLSKLPSATQGFANVSSSKSGAVSGLFSQISNQVANYNIGSSQVNTAVSFISDFAGLSPSQAQGVQQVFSSIPSFTVGELSDLGSMMNKFSSLSSDAAATGLNSIAQTVSQIGFDKVPAMKPILSEMGMMTPEGAVNFQQAFTGVQGIIDGGFFGESMPILDSLSGIQNSVSGDKVGDMLQTFSNFAPGQVGQVAGTVGQFAPFLNSAGATSVGDFLGAVSTTGMVPAEVTQALDIVGNVAPALDAIGLGFIGDPSQMSLDDLMNFESFMGVEDFLNLPQSGLESLLDFNPSDISSLMSLGPDALSGLASLDPAQFNDLVNAGIAGFPTAFAGELMDIAASLISGWCINKGSWDMNLAEGDKEEDELYGTPVGVAPNLAAAKGLAPHAKAAWMGYNWGAGQ